MLTLVCMLALHAAPPTKPVWTFPFSDGPKVCAYVADDGSVVVQGYVPRAWRSQPRLRRLWPGGVVTRLMFNDGSTYLAATLPDRVIVWTLKDGRVHMTIPIKGCQFLDFDDKKGTVTVSGPLKALTVDEVKRLTVEELREWGPKDWSLKTHKRVD
jgi:hypothetical protein